MQLVLTITADTAHELKQAIIGIYDNYKPAVAIETPTPKLIDKKKEKEVKPTLPILPTDEEKIAFSEVTIEEAVATGGDNITLEDIRALMQKVSQAGKRTEVKGLLDKYEAKSLTALEHTHYADLKSRLEKL